MTEITKGHIKNLLSPLVTDSSELRYAVDGVWDLYNPKPPAARRFKIGRSQAPVIEETDAVKERLGEAAGVASSCIDAVLDAYFTDPMERASAVLDIKTLYAATAPEIEDD